METTAQGQGNWTAEFASHSEQDQGDEPNKPASDPGPQPSQGPSFPVLFLPVNCQVINEFNCTQHIFGGLLLVKEVGIYWSPCRCQMPFLRGILMAASEVGFFAVIIILRLP